MERYWVSWYSGYYEDEGCTKPPYQFWASGQRDRQNSVDIYDVIEDIQKLDMNLIHKENAVHQLNVLQKKARLATRDECSYCAMIESNSKDEIWASIEKHFPDFEKRFIEIQEKDAIPSDRFLEFENRVSL